MKYKKGDIVRYDNIGVNECFMIIELDGIHNAKFNLFGGRVLEIRHKGHTTWHPVNWYPPMPTFCPENILGFDVIRYMKRKREQDDK